MVHQKSLSEQAKSRFSILLSTLKIGQLLRNAGITKSFGFSSLAVFQLLFSLVFEGRNWFRLLESERSESLPGKDVIYRFLNQSSFAWRKFLHSFALKIVLHFESLISTSCTRVFIIDDSVLKRSRSKKAELLTHVFDHTTGRFTKGFAMLTLGWSDGFSFAPIDFVMLSSAKLANRICEMKEHVSKRSYGYKRRLEALHRKPDAVVDLLKRALTVGFTADYVLMDSWFTQAPLLRQLDEMGVPVIGMVKELKQRYRLNGKLMTLKELYATISKGNPTEILGSVTPKPLADYPLSSCLFKIATSAENGWPLSART
ncbi:hypothetical protein SAMN04487897_10343 [Paenibacillus sp. yr247]|nr:hypothetical protein SAMN04487897_10343 [Paenibacillus sp. yr247]